MTTSKIPRRVLTNPAGSVRSLVAALVLGFVGLPLASGPAFAQSAADRIEGPVPEEVRAFREAAKRFHDRMAEVHEDTRQYVALREQEEREKVTAGYDGLLDSLVEIDKSRRDLAIERLEDFLERYPDVPYASGARFRLAELYFEVASERYIEDARTYYAALESDDLEVLENLVEPKRDLSGPIALYERIIADNLALPPEERWERLDGVYLMLGFCYYDEISAQRDEERAKEVFRELIQVMPESDLADRSQLFLGNFAFAESQYDEAIAEYEAVVSKGTDGPYYNEAQYQLAWAKFKLNEFEQALTLFTELLDHSEDLKRDTGRESPFAPDARRFMAFSFADLANNQFRDAIEVANEYFTKIGERPYEHDIYVELADVLIRYARNSEALQVYEKLQDDPRWVNHPDNPEYQYQTVMLYSRGISMDLIRAGEERVELTTRYGEGSEWWEANRNNPDALAVARGYIESGLIEVAIEYFVRAQESQDPAAYAVAAAKYQEYLDTFPIADDYYEQQWFLAQAYKYANDWPSAQREFEKLVRGKRYHPYGDGAMFELMNARLQNMISKSGPPEQPCGGCSVFKDGKWSVPVEAPAVTVAVEKTYDARGADPVKIDVYALPEERSAFVSAADAVIDHEFGEVDPRKLPANYPDYAGAFKDLRPKFMYLTGQILYFHNRFDEARPRFERLIDEHPRTDEANFAAGLLVDSYLAEGNLEQVRKYTKKFSTMILGPADVPTDRFQGTLEGSTFMLANQIAEDGEYIPAAEAFMSFMDEFPNSEYLPDALHNAAFYYQEAGKKERANELYEEFVNRFPENDKSRVLYFRIAANYEATFELEKAIDYYERLRKRFPDDINAADALWNASFLRVGIGEHLAAAKGYEAYAEEYPDREDREETQWRAGEQYEKVSDDLALRFYRRYLDEYGLQNPDHAIEAEYRIAEIYDRQGNKRSYERQLDKIVETFDKIVGAGAEVGPEGHRYAAASEYRYVQEMFDDLVDDALTGNDDKDAELLNETKPAELKEFEARAKAFVAKYRNFEWNSGALLLQAKAALYYADLGLSIRCPKGLSDEECWAFEEILEEQVFPEYYAVEQVGVQRLTELVDAARQQKKHSRFIDEALIELNKRDPLEHPAVKLELRGGTEATMPLRPIPMTHTGDLYGEEPKAEKSESEGATPAEGEAGGSETGESATGESATGGSETGGAGTDGAEAPASPEEEQP